MREVDDYSLIDYTLVKPVQSNYVNFNDYFTDVCTYIHVKFKKTYWKHDEKTCTVCKDYLFEQFIKHSDCQNE